MTHRPKFGVCYKYRHRYGLQLLFRTLSDKVYRFVKRNNFQQTLWKGFQPFESG